MGLDIPCGNAQTMWSCLCKMCHCLLDNFPQCQHQQCRITTRSAPTTMPNSQPRHHKRMQVKGPNDDKHRLGPKSKLSNIVFFCFTNCSPQVCFYRHRPSLLHPHIVCALHTLSLPSTRHLCHPHIVCAVHTLSHLICALHTLSASFVPSTRCLYPPYIVCALHTLSVPSIHCL